jgi:hypothetical protein
VTPTVDADGEIAIDTTVADFSHGIMFYYSGKIMGILAMPIAQFTSPTDNDIISYNATNDEFELVAAVTTDEKVGVDSGATPGYLGAASNDGVLRTDGTILTYADGGDYVTLTVADASTTAKGVVDLIVTELAVIKVTKKGLALKEMAQGKTVEEIQALTEPKLRIVRNLKVF